MDAFIGEIRAFTYSYVPDGWLACNGQTASIQTYQALNAIVSGIYGPATQTTFTLPNLNCLAVIGAGSGLGLTPRPVGQQGGAETVALAPPQFPGHTHTLTMEIVLSANALANSTAAPVANQSWLSHPVKVPSAPPTYPIFNFTPATGGSADTTMASQTVGSTGSGTAHENRQPYLTLVYCICYNGIFPQHP